MIPTKGASSRVFELVFDAQTLAELAKQTGAEKLEKFWANLKLTPRGSADWHLNGHLQVSATQLCSITLEPVKAPVNTSFERIYLANYQEPREREHEMQGETETEPLVEEIDLGALMVEVLCLALPDFPRAPGATFDRAIYTAPGIKAMSDDDAKPFAKLAELQKKHGLPDGN